MSQKFLAPNRALLVLDLFAGYGNIPLVCEIARITAIKPITVASMVIVLESRKANVINPKSYRYSLSS